MIHVHAPFENSNFESYFLHAIVVNLIFLFILESITFFPYKSLCSYLCTLPVAGDQSVTRGLTCYPVVHTGVTHKFGTFAQVPVSGTTKEMLILIPLSMTLVP